MALPHPAALRKDVELRYGDPHPGGAGAGVGPWSVDDDDWTTSRRPAAERGSGAHRKPSNQAGIDLSDATFAALGLRDNAPVEWRFVHPGYVPLPRLSLTAPAARGILTAR